MAPNYPQVLFQNRKPDRIATLEEYRQSGGYQALADVIRNYTPKRCRKYSWMPSSWEEVVPLFQPAGN